MKIARCQVLLSKALSKTTIPSGENTALGRTAESILVMARAYESDGRTFSQKGDQVNALAAYWYGFGWLHCGNAFGMLKTATPPVCPFAGSCESLPSVLQPQLAEKTARYGQLLDTARISVDPAPEHSTVARDFAERVLMVTLVYAKNGKMRVESGAPEDALACYSYGHGWLDAGVTAGLFRITGERDLFTL